MTRTPSPSSRLCVEELEPREVPAIIFGVTGANQLVTFDSANPSRILRAVPITGFLSPGEIITDIDVHPVTGIVFGLSNLDRLFLINPFSGFSQLIGNPASVAAAVRGLDFDPRTNLIRIFSDAGENLLQNAGTGAIQRVATQLSYAPGDPFAGGVPRIAGLAFSNNVPNATFTGVFAIDHVRNTLAVPTSMLNNGQLRTVGSLGVNVGPTVGFDIAPITNTAFASFQLAGENFSRLFVVNLGSGHAVQIGPIGNNRFLRDIAVDARGTSGFTSAAGFAALPPPVTTVFTVSSGMTFGNVTFTTSLFPTLTQPLFPTLTQPLSPTLSAPLFAGISGGTFSGGTATSGLLF